MNKILLQKEYDELAESYEQNRGLFDMTPILTTFWKRLSYPSGHLLDLGCGAGEPVAKWFLERCWQVTGIDCSSKMLELARKYTPGMKVGQADMRDLDLEHDKYDAITAVYSLFHLPVPDQRLMFSRIKKWLKPTGKFLFTYATREYTGQTEFSGYIEFMNQQLYYSHTTPDNLRNQLLDAGFINTVMEKIKIGGETFLWVTVES